MLSLFELPRSTVIVTGPAGSNALAWDSTRTLHSTPPPKQVRECSPTHPECARTAVDGPVGPMRPSICSTTGCDGSMRRGVVHASCRALLAQTIIARSAIFQLASLPEAPALYNIYARMRADCSLPLACVAHESPPSQPVRITASPTAPTHIVPAAVVICPFGRRCLHKCRDM